MLDGKDRAGFLCNLELTMPWPSAPHHVMGTPLSFLTDSVHRWYNQNHPNKMLNACMYTYSAKDGLHSRSQNKHSLQDSTWTDLKFCQPVLRTECKSIQERKRPVGRHKLLVGLHKYQLRYRELLMQCSSSSSLKSFHQDWMVFI